MGLYSYSFQSSKEGRVATRTIMRAGGFGPVHLAFRGAGDRRPKPHPPGAPAARHGVRALPSPNSPESEAEAAELKAVEVRPPGNCGASRNTRSARDAGEPACSR